MQKLQDFIIEMLRFYLDQMYPNDSCRIAHLMLIATDMRNVQQICYKDDIDLRWASQLQLDVPELFFEMWA